MRKTSGFLRAVGLFYFVIHVCTTFPDLTFRFLIFFYCDHSALGLNFLKTMQIFVKTLTGKCGWRKLQTSVISPLSLLNILAHYRSYYTSPNHNLLRNLMFCYSSSYILSDHVVFCCLRLDFQVRPSLLMSSHRIQSIMWRPKFKIRKEFHLTNSVWSSLGNNSKMDAHYLIIISRRSLRCTLSCVLGVAYMIPLWLSWRRATTVIRQFAASVMLVFHLVLQTAERRSVDTPIICAQRKSLNKETRNLQ